jgi:CDP-diacylglycerol--glycerol-3-phosphate 3-phosphatidyltransferase
MSGSERDGRIMPKVRQSSIRDHQVFSQADLYELSPSGIWLSPGGPSGSSTPQKPCATFVGSSNLSTRSMKLDLELSNIILTTSNELRTKMAAELGNIRSHSERVGEETWKLPERRVSLYARILMMLGVEGML